ncbi:MAG: hypothetical protein HYZ65_04690 [Burkholderiales bacterium]|nr:hypothetical protein [Burkholderiales bacterium]
MPGNRSRKKRRKYQQRLRRRDQITRMLVDLGIHYLSTLGLEHAGNFLRQQNVPDAVIARVLLFPRLRRRY